MEKTNIAIEKKQLQKTSLNLPLSVDNVTIFLSIFSFFCARADISSLGSTSAFALASALLSAPQSFFPAFIFIPLGILSKGYYAQLKTDILISLIFLLLHFSFKPKKNSGLFLSLTGALAVILGKVIFPFIFDLTPMSSFSVISSSLGVFLLVFPFYKALHFLKKPSSASHMDTASFFILVSLSACGLYYIIPSVPLHLSAFSFAILCASFYGGPLTGTLMGVLSGLFISLCGVSSPEIFPAFSLFGAAAGFMRTKGKLFTAVSSSLIFALLLAYFYPSILDFTSGALLSAAAAVFILTPIKNTAYFSLPISESEISESEHLLRVKLHTASRLFSASSGFKTLSSLFKEEPSDFTMTSSLPEIMKRVKKRSCKNCGMSHYCWVRDFEKTKGLFSQSISIYENKGNLSPRDFSKIYSDFCIEPENLLSAMNKEFEIHKRDIFWQMKLKENRYILKEELFAFSKILDDLSAELSKGIIFKPELEKKAFKKLREAGLPILEISIWENPDRSQNASIKIKASPIPFSASQKIIPIMNSVMNCKLRQKSKSTHQLNSLSSFLELESISGLTVFAGASSWGKDKEGFTGDCYSIMDMHNKKILALSDGMGFGLKAGKESRKVMELLEHLVDSGLKEDFSIKLINSSLVPQNTKENFSTLDVCVIDKSTGSGEFFKAGASSAYIIRGNKIKSIKSSSLPVGIIAEAKTENIPITLRPGDIIIMVTDGVWDIIEKKGGDLWLSNRLDEIHSKNPSSLSEYLLNEARKDVIPSESDDMTVLCAKVWGKAV